MNKRLDGGGCGRIVKVASPWIAIFTPKRSNHFEHTIPQDNQLLQILYPNCMNTEFVSLDREEKKNICLKILSQTPSEPWGFFDTLRARILSDQMTDEEYQNIYQIAVQVLEEDEKSRLEDAFRAFQTAQTSTRNNREWEQNEHENEMNDALKMLQTLL